MPEEFSLGMFEVDVAVRRAGLPASWAPFDVRSAVQAAGDDAIATYDRLNTEAWDALRARRLADRDKLDVDVAHTLRAWTQPDVLIIVRATELADRRRVYYRATIAEGLGVLSEQVGDNITFLQIRPDRLVDAMVGTLPPYRPVPVRPVTITRRSRPAPQGDRDFSAEDFTAEPSRAEQEALTSFSQWPPHRLGSVELHVRSSHSVLHNQGAVTFFDSEGGRFLVFTEPLSGGETRLRYVPSDGSHLRRWLHDTIAEVAR
ncbi:ESX secretion-associated protein EspG [Amycolatopsis sp. NPDC059027]|uniref:ESX secretion-associated protein EspG n=1 Tax=unclassified Amycolatopsis TaxID=2618356 RepID=UPI00366ACF2C